MRNALLVCLLLLGSLRPLLSAAQTPPTSAGPAPALVTRQDTVRALHHLFATRRRTGKHLITAGLFTLPVAFVAALIQAVNRSGASSGTIDYGSALAGLGALGGFHRIAQFLVQ